MKRKFICKRNLILMIFISFCLAIKPLPAQPSKCIDALKKCISLKGHAENGMEYCALGYIWCVTFIGK
jgi:hypothetical protein